MENGMKEKFSLGGISIFWYHSALYPNSSSLGTAGGVLSLFHGCGPGIARILKDSGVVA